MDSKMNGKKIPVNDDSPVEFQVIDKRHIVDPDGVGVETPVEEKPRYPSYVEELMGRMVEMEKRFEEKKTQMADEVARTKARLEGDYRRRIELEKQRVLLPFLDVLDNLERAMEAATRPGDREALLEGVAMTGALFRSRLQAHGVEPIQVIDQPFDPNVGEAIGVVTVTEADRDGLVVEEVQRGYRIGDQLVRPAQVRVGRYEEPR
jgi:molecular chaperone GrpE